MDQDSPGRIPWHGIRERALYVRELHSKLNNARASLRAERVALREQDELKLKLCRAVVSQPDAESVTLLHNLVASWDQARDGVRQLDEEVEKIERELMAASRDLYDIEEHLHTAIETSSRGSRNEGKSSLEHCKIDWELWPRDEQASRSSRNLLVREPVGGTITAQPQKVVRCASAAVQSYLAKLGDVNLLREQLSDFEDHYAHLVHEYYLMQDCGLEESVESRKFRKDFAEQQAALAKRLKQDEETLTRYVADLRRDNNLDHDLQFMPAYGLLGENERSQTAEFWRNLEAESTAKPLNFETEAETRGEEYFSSALFQEGRESARRAARFRASHSTRKDALETPLLAQPRHWLDWSRRSRRGRGQRRNRSYWNARKRDPCFNPFERDCLFGDADGSLSEPAVAQLDSLSDMPFCISLRYLKEIGKECEMSTDLTDANLLDIRGGKVHGIIRKMAFRVKGTSVTFRKDFFVTDMLDDLVDVVFGWSFMASEFTLLFKRASDIFSDGMTGVKDAISGFPTKVTKVASAVQRRASEFISRTPSPSPPYSLCDILAPDFYL